MTREHIIDTIYAIQDAIATALRELVSRERYGSQELIADPVGAALLDADRLAHEVATELEVP